MNWPYFHLVTNHFPVILTLTGTAAALVAFLLRRRAVWIYALATLSLAGLGSLPAFLTGNQAEETMEDRAGIAKLALDSHEEASEVALWVVLVMGAAAAMAWWRMAREDRRGPSPSWIRPAVLVVALAGTGTVSYAAFLGGKILHGANDTSLSRPVAGQVPAEGDEDHQH